MKNILNLKHILVLIFAVSLFSCSGSDIIKEPTFREKEVEFFKEYREIVRGDWKISKMVIAKKYLFSDPANDSIVIDLGKLFVNNIHNDPIHPDLYNQLEATIYIGKQATPVKSSLLACPTIDAEIYGANGLVESGYYTPDPIIINELSEENYFLYNYVFGDYYVMTLSEDGNTWTWKGLNRFIREIIFTKNTVYID